MLDVAVVGAGPAGLMAACSAAKAGSRVAVFEQLTRPGVKLLATGGGRCNLTNTLPLNELVSRFGEASRFVKPALSALPPSRLCDFLDSIGVPTHCPDGFHIFPVSNTATTVQRALTAHCAFLGVEARLGAEVRGLWLDGGALRGIETAADREAVRCVVLATGGRSYPELGATGSGYEIARGAGHGIAKPCPALVPLVSDEAWVRDCAGVTLSGVRLTLQVAGKAERSATGDLLFTHRGLSGPAALDLSGDVASVLDSSASASLLLNLVPGTDAAEWQERFASWQRHQGKKMLRTLLSLHLPASIARVICDLAGSTAERRMAELARDQRSAISRCVTALPLTVVGTEGFSRAMVTRGGVPLTEVQPRTLMSRIQSGLFFAGEMLDVDGPCGGFNLQWAFASGHVAGAAAAAAARAD